MLTTNLDFSPLKNLHVHAMVLHLSSTETSLMVFTCTIRSHGDTQLPCQPHLFLYHSRKHFGRGANWNYNNNNLYSILIHFLKVNYLRMGIFLINVKKKTFTNIVFNTPVIDWPLPGYQYVWETVVSQLVLVSDTMCRESLVGEFVLWGLFSLFSSDLIISPFLTYRL